MSRPSFEAFRPEAVTEKQSGLARHTAINLLGGIFAPAASFAAGPILAHALSVEGRGELAAATMPLVLTVTLAAVGLPEAVTYFVAGDRRRTRMVARRGGALILIPAAVSTALLILVAPWLSNGNPTVHRLIILSALLVAPSLLLSIIRAIAAAHNRWAAVTVERMITAITKLVPLVVLFATGRLDLIAAAIITMASSLAGVLAYIPLWALRKHDSETAAITKTDLLRFGGGIWIGSISGVILMRIDQVILSPLSSTFQLGLYAVAVSISELPLIANAAIRDTAFTHLSDRGVSPREIGELSRVSTIIVVALCVPVGLLSPILVPMLFGPGFTGAVPLVLVLLLAVSLGNSGSLAGVGLSSSGHPHLRSFALVVACLVNVSLLLVLAPSLGATGAAIATLVGNLTSSNLCIIWMIRRQGATIGDYYRFRRADFVTVARVLARMFRKVIGKVRTR